MPRKAKDVEILDDKKEKKKKVTTKNTKTTKKETVKSINKSESKTTKKSKDITEKKTTTKKTVSKNTTKAKNTNTKSTNIKSAKRSVKPQIDVLEYYDLPYKYNKTVIKLLAQTPTSLFVYWEISDEDRENYIKEFGENFFNNTKPVLVVTNETMNYSFEVDINDFANCWYLHVKDSKCVYKITLGRRPINHYINIPNNYLYITDSNVLESPNNQILIDSLGHSVFFKNVKTNKTTEKEINSFSFMQRIGSLYNIYDLYHELYKDEDIYTTGNPSSPINKLNF